MKLPSPLVIMGYAFCAILAAVPVPETRAVAGVTACVLFFISVLI